MDIWHLLPYYIDPIAIKIGFIEIRWYSLMYLTAILSVVFLFGFIAKKRKEPYYIKHTLDFFNWGAVGIIVGARLGYVIFYNAKHYISKPLEIIWPFSNGEFVGISGLSYHGGAIGFFLALYLCSRRYKLSFPDLINRFALLVPLGYFFGRIGNFLNLELYGRTTTSFLGMYFPNDGSTEMRYPSQLFEAAGEGVLLFVLLLISSKYNSKITTPLYIIYYSIIRFFLEYFREPDSFQKLVFGLFSYGQTLSIAMLIFGIVLVPYFNKNAK